MWLGLIHDSFAPGLASTGAEGGRHLRPRKSGHFG